MFSLLDDFINNRTTALIGAPLLLAVLVAMFIRDIRRVRRGEPIQLFGSRKVYPNDRWYNFMFLSYFRPYFVIFGLIALFVLVLGGVQIWIWLGGA